MTDELRAAIVDAALAAYGEDYQAMASLVRILREADPSDWIAVLRVQASAYEPFATSGLSVEWWVDTVDQMSR